MAGKITLLIPRRFFSADFLNIEVKKCLGIRGDDLIQHFRGDMQELHKNNKNSRLFNHDMIYMVKSTNGSVVLTGLKI